MAATLFVVFSLALLLNVPVVFALALGCVSAVLVQGGDLMFVAKCTATGVDKVPLLAVPLFIIMGEIISRGECGKYLANLAQAAVGNITGGMAHATVLASMFFGGVSGAASADVAAIGSVLIPATIKAGYDPKFATNVTISASILGIIIPPSIILILYGWISGTSVGDLFIGGLIPGVLVGIALMIVSYVISRKHGYRSNVPFSGRRLASASVRALPVLVMPILIIGGIFGGLFTATEAAAVAVMYGLVITLVFYKGLKIRDIPDLIRRAGTTIGMVMFLIAVCSTFGWIMAAEEVPRIVSEFFMTYLPWRPLFLLNVIIICLFIGMFLTPGASIIILTPILYPVAQEFGINGVHFGMVMVSALAMGHLTPPVGLCLYIGSSISGIPVAELVPSLIPFILVVLAVALLIAYVPAITLWLPMLLG